MRTAARSCHRCLCGDHRDDFKYSITLGRLTPVSEPKPTDQERWDENAARRAKRAKRDAERAAKRTYPFDRDLGIPPNPTEPTPAPANDSVCFSSSSHVPNMDGSLSGLSEGTCCASNKMISS